MSFSWVYNSISGPSSELDWSPAAWSVAKASPNVSVAANFPSGHDMRTPTAIPQSAAQKGLGTMYQVGEYLVLRDMVADKSPLIYARGGFDGTNPQNMHLAKSQCNSLQKSAGYYCGNPNAGVYGI